VPAPLVKVLLAAQVWPMLIVQHQAVVAEEVLAELELPEPQQV
jgi:hypothetical protein